MEGGARYPDFDYPDEEYYYFAMAERFGWTPEQTDNCPAYFADWMLAIGATIDQVKADKMEQQ